MTTPVKIYYWPIRARSYATMAVLQAGGIPIDWEKNPDLASLKASSLPFGQLPYIEHGDVKIAQSGAILRYAGGLAGTSGGSGKPFAVSEMLIAEAEDLFNMMGKANYSSDKAAAYTELFAANGPFATQCAFLDKLIPDGETFFLPGPVRSTGGYAIAATLDLAVGLEPTILDATPKLKTFYQTMLASSAFDGIRDLPMYFSRA